MNYALNIDNRKDFVKKIEALTGLKSRYTMMPRCAYEIGAFTVEKDGSLTVVDDADQNVIEALLAEQMIVPASSDEDEPETAAPADSEDRVAILPFQQQRARAHLRVGGVGIQTPTCSRRRRSRMRCHISCGCRTSCGPRV